jgi:DNA polymerase I
LRTLHEAYPDFWRWSDGVVDRAMITGMLRTPFGWQLRAPPNPNPRSFQNFPMQASGAEMMRLAACLATERGIEVCAPVHDAFLICAPLDRLDADVERMRACMAEASRIVLGGFELRTDADIIRYPNRYRDERGATMWERVTGLLSRFPASPATPTTRRNRTSGLPTGSGKWAGVPANPSAAMRYRLV